MATKGKMTRRKAMKMLREQAEINCLDLGSWLMFTMVAISMPIGDNKAKLIKAWELK